MVYKLTVSYRGAAYAGWQRQANARTVQQTLEAAVGAWLGAEVTVVGASRTDAGVHARGQVAHLEIERELPLGALVHASNHHLPEDIRVLSACRMRDGFHARKCARAKEYRYRVVPTRILSPLDAPFAARADPDLDLETMRRATALLVGRHDFTAFALAGGAHRQPFRNIQRARWSECDGGWSFSVVGDGFLRGMVRSLVGTLLEVGRGRITVADVSRLLEGAPRSAAGPTAPACGLTLEQVLYPAAWESESRAEGP